MRLFAINIMLTLAWCGLLGSFNTATLASGFIIAYLVLFVVFRGDSRHDSYLYKFPKTLSFLCYYIWKIFESNVVVAYDILTPTHLMKPGVVAIPLAARTDLEITLLANLITMTPGTLSLDISTDRKTLYVHAMYIEDPEKLRREIKHDLERRVLEILR